MEDHNSALWDQVALRMSSYRARSSLLRNVRTSTSRHNFSTVPDPSDYPSDNSSSNLERQPLLNSDHLTTHHSLSSSAKNSLLPESNGDTSNCFSDQSETFGGDQQQGLWYLCNGNTSFVNSVPSVSGVNTSRSNLFSTPIFPDGSSFDVNLLQLESNLELDPLRSQLLPDSHIQPVPKSTSPRNILHKQGKYKRKRLETLTKNGGFLDRSAKRTRIGKDSIQIRSDESESKIQRLPRARIKHQGMKTGTELLYELNWFDNCPNPKKKLDLARIICERTPELAEREDGFEKAMNCIRKNETNAIVKFITSIFSMEEAENFLQDVRGKRDKVHPGRLLKYGSWSPEEGYLPPINTLSVDGESSDDSLGECSDDGSQTFRGKLGSKSEAELDSGACAKGDGKHNIQPSSRIKTSNTTLPSYSQGMGLGDNSALTIQSSSNEGWLDPSLKAAPVDHNHVQIEPVTESRELNFDGSYFEYDLAQWIKENSDLCYASRPNDASLSDQGMQDVPGRSVSSQLTVAPNELDVILGPEILGTNCNSDPGY